MSWYRRPGLVLAAGLVVASVLLPPAVQAQVAPADTAAVLYDVARQLDAEGRADLARALYRLIVERYGTAPAAALAAERLAERRPVSAEGSGRTELIVWSTLYGLWLGAAVPGALGSNSAEAYGVGLLAGGPLGFLAAKRYTDGRPILEGQARAITFGGTWGTWQGFGWREVFDIGSKTRTYCSGPDGPCFEEGEDGEQAAFAAAMIGGLAGIVAGEWAANRYRPTAGTATMVDFGALWGTWYGFVAGIVADADGDELLAATLLGGNAGLVTTAVLAPGWNMSRSRARLINIAGVAGLLGGFGLDLIVQPSDDKVAVLIPAVTSALGLWLGAGWTRDHDRAPASVTPGAGALIDVRDGRLGLDLPRPMPALLPVRSDAGVLRLEPALRVDLLRAVF